MTLTYDYRDSLVAVGPLSPTPDPHGYDLCVSHDRRLLVPQGWRTVRFDAPGSDAPGNSDAPGKTDPEA